MSEILKDVLEPGLEVVFCGTAVGPKSAKKGAYYAGPGNRFWSILADSGLTPTCMDPSEYASLPQHGIGLTDLVKTKAALDADLADEWDVDGFRGKMVRYAPTFIAFNGKRAAQEYYGKKVSYGEQTESIGQSTVFVLPSTSGAARKFWNVAPWKALARQV